MWPLEINLGPFQIAAVDLLIFLGLAAAALVARKRFDPVPGTIPQLDFMLAALVGGLLGGRLFTLLPAWLRGMEATPWGAGLGSAFYGAVILGAAGIAVAMRIHGHPVRRGMDVVASVTPLAFFFGKIGCFLSGCCYGLVCEGFPGVRFPQGSLAHTTHLEEHRIGGGAAESLSVHPAQLYEAAFGLVLFAFLSWLWRRSKRRGEVVLAWLTLYPLWRFWIEFLRDDPGRHGFGAGLSDSQIVSLVLFFPAAAGWIWMRFGRGDEAPSGEPPPQEQAQG